MRRLLVVGSAAAILVSASNAHAARVINVEVDWMQTAGHSHQLQSAEIAAVQQMFACHGVTINIVQDQAIPEVAVMQDTSGSAFFNNVNDSLSFGHLRSKYFGHIGQAGWHYCILGHDYFYGTNAVGSSGLARINGYDFTVTMGSFTGQIGTPFDRAASFAHELGHNLGLDHAGTMDTKVVGNFVPIYPSIMSYDFQLSGVKTHLACLGIINNYHRFKDMDYSNGRMPSVDENALSEPQGLGMTAVDWNCDGSIGGTVAHDLDSPSKDGKWCDAAGTKQVLVDTNDWAIVLNSIDHPPSPQQEPAISEPCPTAELQLRQRFRAESPSGCVGAQPALVTEGCVASEMEFLDAAALGTVTGTGTQPFHDLPTALAAAPVNSVFFFKSNTYHSGAGIIGTPATLTGPQSFTIIP